MNTTSEPPLESELPQQPLLAHMQELRRRLMVAVGSWMGFSLLCYGFVQDIYQMLAAPLRDAFGDEVGRRLMYTGLTEAFVVYLKTALWGGLILSLPIFLYQIWAFLAPGLYPREKGIVRGFFIAGPVLFLMGLLLAYFGVIPLAWHFFLSFQSQEGLPIQIDPKMDDYFGLILHILLAFGVAFLFPLVLAILIYRNVIGLDRLKQYRRHVFVAILMVAAVITPPDVISQLALALPLWVLFEGTLWLCGWMQRRGSQVQDPESKIPTPEKKTGLYD
jgi:sec-independent protein translocase protein TatC